LLDKESISKLCDELGLQPTVFYRWQKEFFENGASAFAHKARPNHSAEQERITYLEKKIQTKDEVLRRAQALSSRWLRINNGTSTCRTSTSAGRSITCAVFWTAAVATL
jgi:hypothetical protein